MVTSFPELRPSRIRSAGSIIPGAGGAEEGINVIDNDIQNPMVQQFNLGVQYQFAKDWIIRADGIHNLGTHFLIGVPGRLGLQS